MAAGYELIPDTIVLGEANYQQAIRQVIAHAERELLIFDQDLAKGDYASVAMFELLRDFLAKDRQNRLVMVLHDTSYFTQRCPRLFELLALYGHIMTVYETNDYAKVAKDSFVIADQKHYVRRFHIDQPRFRYAFDHVEAAMLNKRFDELLAETSVTVSTTTLGL